MKSSLLTTITLLLMNVSIISAQVTLEKTYSYSTSIAEISDGEYCYYLMDVPMAQCRIYSTSHSLLKTINITVPTGYYLSDIKFVTKHLFNTDDLIEILYIYEKYVTTTNWYYYDYGLGIINENGTSLLSIDNGAWAEINKIGDNYKLLAYTYIYNVSGYYDVTSNVYNLGGNTESFNAKAVQSNLVYPNPTSQQINVELSKIQDLGDGQFSLFDMQGSKVYSIPVKGGQLTSLQVEQLPKGMYMYTLKSNTKLIQSNKIIIQ